MFDKNRLYLCLRCYFGSVDGIVGILICGVILGFFRAFIGLFWFSAFLCKMVCSVCLFSISRLMRRLTVLLGSRSFKRIVVVMSTIRNILSLFNFSIISSRRDVLVRSVESF